MIAATLSISMDEKLPRSLLPIWSVIFRPLRMRTKQQSRAIFVKEKVMDGPGDVVPILPFDLRFGDEDDGQSCLEPN